MGVRVHCSVGSGCAEAFVMNEDKTKKRRDKNQARNSWNAVIWQRLTWAKTGLLVAELMVRPIGKQCKLSTRKIQALC